MGSIGWGRENPSTCTRDMSSLWAIPWASIRLSNAGSMLWNSLTSVMPAENNVSNALSPSYTFDHHLQTVIWVSNNSYISMGTIVSHAVADYSDAMHFLLLFYWQTKTVPFPKRELNTMQSMWIFSISDCPLVPPSSSVLLKWSCLGVSWNLLCPA